MHLQGLFRTYHVAVYFSDLESIAHNVNRQDSDSTDQQADPNLVRWYKSDVCFITSTWSIIS